MANRKKNRSSRKLPALPRRALVARLSAAEETLRAIRPGEVDAIVVNDQGGEKVFTLQGADHTYRVFAQCYTTKIDLVGITAFTSQANRALPLMKPG